MYKLWTDKQELFEAKIQLSGATFQNTKCRLVIESDTLNLMFNGEVSDSGKVTIPVTKMKSILDEGTEGMIRLEVIADDTLCTPWESNFQVDTAKKIDVSIVEQQPDTTPKISVEAVINSPDLDVVDINEKSTEEKNGRNGERAKHLRSTGKKIANKRTRKSFKVKRKDVTEVIKLILQRSTRNQLNELTSQWDVEYKLEVLKEASAIMKKG